MKFVILAALVVLMIAFGGSAVAQRTIKPRPETVALAITSASSTDANLHWAITNHNDMAVYVYDFYLWGPALSMDESQGRSIFSTTPTVEEPSCPPNRFAPVLLLVIGPGRTISGELQDERIKPLAGRTASLVIAVGSEPYTVAEEAKRFYNSNCKHSPNDAIVRWGTIIESKPTRVQ